MFPLLNPLGSKAVDEFFLYLITSLLHTINEEKKINMSDYILKKDCQKNLEEMKSKLEKEYQKKIEIEKNKNLEEKRRYEEKIEIINNIFHINYNYIILSFFCYISN